MAPKSRGAKRFFDLLSNPSRETHVCLSCRHHLAKRGYASLATAQATVESPPISQVTPDGPEASPAPQPNITIKAGIVVSRPPLLTPDPHPFETAYYLYQRRLNERLVLPFTQYFYYKRGSPAFALWRRKRAERGGVAARDIGKYNAYTKESWNDEVLVGDDVATPRNIIEQLIEEEGRSSEFSGEGGDHKTAGLKRTTDADQNNDQRSLERSLSRTLYLLVKNKTNSKGQTEDKLWQFPSGSLEMREGLREAAERILGLSCGQNMNTWFVGNHPVGHYVERPKIAEAKSNNSSSATQKTEDTLDDATKTFFMKARIFAGQADLKNNTNDVEDYKWLSKDEVEKQVAPEYWLRVKNMLVEQ